MDSTVSSVYAVFASIVVCLLICDVTPFRKPRDGGSLTVSASKKTGQKFVIELDEENWLAILQGEWMVEFFAPWCPACRNLASTWDRFAENAFDLNVNVAKIDVTTSPSLSGRFFVTALPTIYHVKDGEFRQYRGSRDIDSVLLFLKQKQWQNIAPVSAWKKPDTIHMSILSYFFKLSHTLKDFNTHLQEEFGLPTWGSYALFAIGTILVGAALGLLLVCIVDFLYPPKKSHRKNFSESKGQLYNGVEDIASDEIEDDPSAQNPNEQDNVQTESKENKDEAIEDESENSSISESDETENDRNSVEDKNRLKSDNSD